MPRIYAAGRSDPGRRPDNQDTFRISASQSLSVIADGMGGHKGGKTASQMAADTVEEMTALSEGNEQSDTRPHDGSFLIQAVLEANHRIYQKSQGNPDLKEMGTTVTALWINDRSAWVAQVGDSRCYFFQADSGWQITHDHSFVQRLIDDQKITPLDAKSHPYRNQLTRSVGFEPELQVDLIEFPIQPGDIFLLCSDGISNAISMSELQEHVRNSGLENPDIQSKLDRLAQSLIDQGNARGGEDNLTVVVVYVGEVP